MDTVEAVSAIMTFSVLSGLPGGVIGWLVCRWHYRRVFRVSDHFSGEPQGRWELGDEETERIVKALRPILGFRHRGDLLERDGSISRDRGVRIEILGGEGVIEYHGPTLPPFIIRECVSAAPSPS
jgi:hypothetical protein